MRAPAAKGPAAEAGTVPVRGTGGSARGGEEGLDFGGLEAAPLAHAELAKAQRLGHLHRNFQGYSTRAECDLAAFGVSAIGAIGATYSQNVKTLPEYYDLLDRGVLPVMRGIALNADDLVRRAVIQSLMCHFEVSIDAIEETYLVDFRRHFAAELAALREYADLGLVELESDWVTVTPRGRLLVRAICMVFDRYLQEKRTGATYSRVV